MFPQHAPVRELFGSDARSKVSSVDRRVRRCRTDPSRARSTRMASAFVAVDVVVVLARITVGLILFYAGATKLVSLSVFAESVRLLPIPRFMTRGERRFRALVVAVPLVEIALGLSFAIGHSPRATGGLIVLLLLAFSGLLARRDPGAPAPCGCFGRGSSQSESDHPLVRNAGLLLFTVVGMQSAAVDPANLSKSPEHWFLLVCLLLLLIAAVVTRSRRPAEGPTRPPVTM